MRAMCRVLGGLLLSLTVVMGAALPASAAHNGNNKANVTGDGGIYGDAVVNHSAGTGTFSGGITVYHLEPGETYTFSVRTPGAETVICSGEANGGGTFTCSAQGLALPGFSVAVVRDGDGEEIASGVFSRGGNCRDPRQVGSQCAAPGLAH